MTLYGSGDLAAGVGRGYANNRPDMPTARNVVQITSVAIGISSGSARNPSEVIGHPYIVRTTVAKLRGGNANTGAAAKLINLVKYVQHVKPHFE